MTPIVDGRVLHLEFRGLYDGVSILWDRESGSLWHHITGQALHGPLKGRTLAPVGNVLHTIVSDALAADSTTRVAISARPIRQESRWAPWVTRLPLLGDAFRRTMAREDTRRPAMDVGLGVWGDSTARYYPLETLVNAGGAVVDTFLGRRLVVYVSPESGAPAAFYTGATQARWNADRLELSTGAVVRHGALYAPSGERLAVERPLQVFTRWYGFALTFPGTEIFAAR